jgi:hypothetical protein
VDGVDVPRGGLGFHQVVEEGVGGIDVAGSLGDGEVVDPEGARTATCQKLILGADGCQLRCCNPNALRLPCLRPQWARSVPYRNPSSGRLVSAKLLAQGVEVAIDGCDDPFTRNSDFGDDRINPWGQWLIRGHRHVSPLPLARRVCTGSAPRSLPGGTRAPKIHQEVRPPAGCGTIAFRAFQMHKLRNHHLERAAAPAPPLVRQLLPSCGTSTTLLNASAGMYVVGGRGPTVETPRGASSRRRGRPDHHDPRASNVMPPMYCLQETPHGASLQWGNLAPAVAARRREDAVQDGPFTLAYIDA